MTNYYMQKNYLIMILDKLKFYEENSSRNFDERSGKNECG